MCVSLRLILMLDTCLTLANEAQRAVRVLEALMRRLLVEFWAAAVQLLEITEADAHRWRMDFLL